MDNKELDFGLDEEAVENTEETKEKVVSLEEKKVRKPWVDWDVGGRTYKLILSTTNIMKVEEKYRTNIVNLISVDGLPRLSVMLTIVQAAMLEYQHGIRSDKVTAIYEQYLREGGSQTDLLSDVIIPVMSVSGFFTETQAAVMESKMDGMDALI
mgnify:CR=1 FL=1